MIWQVYFSRKVLLSPFVIFLCLLHTVANLTTVAEYWADEKPYGYMLWRLPLGFVFIFGVLFLFTLAGYGMARSRITCESRSGHTSSTG